MSAPDLRIAHPITVVGVRAYRRQLQSMFYRYPDDSHGDGHFNAGITAALRALNKASGVDMETPCERVTDPDMGGGWCGAHHAWLGRDRWCDLAQCPWTWAPPQTPPR